MTFNAPSRTGPAYSATCYGGWIFLTAMFAPALLTANLALLIVAKVLQLEFDVAAWMAPDSDGEGGVLLSVYRYSALRAIPFIPFLLTPLAVLLDVLGDVLFYLLPDGHSVSTGAITQRRLQDLLDTLAAGDCEKVVIVAHSQGSVIAADSLANPPVPVTLVTVGSPIDTLYRRYLDIRVGRRLKVSSWINCYRLGDYIGGSVERAEPDRHIGIGGHTHYWTAKQLQSELNHVPL